MRKWLLFPLMALLFSCTLFAREPLPVYNGPRRNLILTPVGGDVDRSYRETARGKLEEITANSSYFDLIDRDAVDVALADLRLTSFGVIDEQTTATIGKQLGAQVAMSSSVTSLKVESGQGGSAKYGYYSTYTTKATVSLKIIDVETGRVLAASRDTGSAYSSKSRGADDDEKAIESAISDAAYSVLRQYASRN
jgi:Curli production assembly/transport component CsgG